MATFQHDGSFAAEPAIFAEKLVQITIRKIAPVRASRAIKIGEVCFLRGKTYACLAVASAPDGPQSGFLVLEGDLKGKILTGLQASLCVGTVAIDLLPV